MEPDRTSPPRAGARRPLIVITEPEGRDGPLATSLASRGADVFSLPTVRIADPEDFGPLDRALAEVDRFQWIVFTSRHAVDAVSRRPGWTDARHRATVSLRVAAVGRTTAARLSQIGVIADLVPEDPGASSLAALLVSGQASGPILWPRSDIARRELPDALRRAGAEVTEPIAYRTVCASLEHVDAFVARVESGEIDGIVFLSPSSARNLAAILGRSDLALLSSRVVVASLGPTTSDALRELSSPPDVESAARTAEDLAATLLSYLETHPRAAR